MSPMFAIEYYGLFVRADGLMTDNKSSAKLFPDLLSAENYLVNEWFPNPKVNLPNDRKPVNLIQVSVKVVMKKAGPIIKSF